MSHQQTGVGRRRGYRGWIVAAVVVLGGIATLVLWARGPVYAQYTDGVRPTVVFVWSDPTLHHPHG